MAESKPVTRRRHQRSSKAGAAQQILDAPIFQEAQQRQIDELLTAMERLDLNAMTYEEAAGRALALVAKLQATRAQQKSFQTLITYAQLEEKRAQ